MTGIVRRLSSGFYRLETPGGKWAQVPPDFTGRESVPDWEDSTIPDEYIFQPDWNREEINAWFRQHGEAMLKKMQQDI